jgi:hypothetical protein
VSSELLQRYARHRLLTEIGDSGQLRLSAASFRLAAGADAQASAWARGYLERAGPCIAEGGACHELAVPSSTEVSALAGRPLLREAAAALAGAFAAVEAIKRVTGAGQPASLPPGLVLDRDAGQ